MPKQFALRDHFREIRLFQSRVVIAFAVTTLFTLAIIGRLAYLQILGHEKFSTLSQDNRVNIIALPPTRGLIYDRNGILLAQNVPAFSLEVTPEQVKHPAEAFAELSKIIPLNEDDIQRFTKVSKQKPKFESVALRIRMTDEEVARFAVNRYRFPGIDIVARLVRNYPLGPLGVHALGYVARINEDELARLDPSNYNGTSHIGKAGVEKAYEDLLHGSVGVQQVEVNAIGRVLRVLEESPPTPGRNLILTIDAQLQLVAENALGDKLGAVVAIDPKTGDVLAMASTPTYDPNPFVVGIDTKAFQELQRSEDQPLFNRALRGQYPPGSTIKPFVGLAGLEYDKIDFTTKTFCPGWFSIGSDEHRYRDWRKGGHGSISLRAAITQSCDVYFYDLSLSLGIDNLHSYLGKFGFGKATNIDVGGEVPALLPSREWKRKAYNQAWYQGETVIAGIGQGYVLATPLQLASATAALANHGVRMQPRTVKGIQDPQTQVVTPVMPKIVDNIHFNNTDHWQQVVDAMTDVIHSASGTAKSISKNLPYRIAGKTGTAQVFGVAQDEKYDASKLDEKLQDHALFVAFAPADDPKIAIAVIVEHGGHGGSTAAPVARQVLDYYLLASQEGPHGNGEAIAPAQGTRHGIEQ